MHRMTHAMAHFSLTKHPSPLLEKYKIPLEVCLVWNSPEDNSWHILWLSVMFGIEGCIVVWCWNP